MGVNPSDGSFFFKEKLILRIEVNFLRKWKLNFLQKLEVMFLRNRNNPSSPKPLLIPTHA